MIHNSLPRRPANRWLRPAAIALLLVLSLFVLVRGVVPGFSAIHSDFPNYFTAARIVAEGGPTERLYDDGWFEEQIHREFPGVDVHGKFAPFPPSTALLLLPLSRLSPLAALRVTNLVNLLCLALSIWLLARIVPLTLLHAAVLALLSAYSICSALRLGQPYIVVSASCLGGYYLWSRNRPLLAGLCWGIFLPIKYFPAFILIYLALRRQWRAVLGGLLATVAVVLAGVGVLGWKVHEVFLSSVLVDHLTANINHSPFSAAFQSFDTLFRRLFVFDATDNPHPWIASPALYPAAVMLVKASVLVITVTTLVRLARNDPADSTAPSLGLLGIVLLLIAPATASYYLVLLWLPVGLLVGCFLRERARVEAALLLGSYALLGFFPNGYTARFEGRGGLSVLAYPRLFLLVAMFSTCVYFMWRRVPSTAQTAAAPTC